MLHFLQQQLASSKKTQKYVSPEKQCASFCLFSQTNTGIIAPSQQQNRVTSLLCSCNPQRTAIYCILYSRSAVFCRVNATNPHGVKIKRSDPLLLAAAAGGGINE